MDSNSCVSVLAVNEGLFPKKVSWYSLPFLFLQNPFFEFAHTHTWFADVNFCVVWWNWVELFTLLNILYFGIVYVFPVFFVLCFAHPLLYRQWLLANWNILYHFVSGAIVLLLFFFFFIFVFICMNLSECCNFWMHTIFHHPYNLSLILWQWIYKCCASNIFTHWMYNNTMLMKSSLLSWNIWTIFSIGYQFHKKFAKIMSKHCIESSNSIFQLFQSVCWFFGCSF